MLRTIVVLLIVLFFYSCSQQKSTAESKIEPSTNQRPVSKTGLKFETTPTRGVGLIDSLGFEYGIVYITHAITNNSTIPIDLQMALPIDYSYPISDEFKIVLWPGLTEPPHLSSDSQGRYSENFTTNYMQASNQFNKLLAPGEKYNVTIGTIQYFASPKTCSAVAYSLLQYSERRDYSDCDWAMDEDQTKNPQLLLGLQVGFCTSGLHYESCTIIPCGQITYIED